MKKKGFTLIELIAVLAILSIIIVISVPQLLNMIDDSKEDAREKVYKLIESAARIYASDYKLGESEPILISVLCENNYLDCPIIDPVTEEEMAGYVFSSVTKDEFKSIEYKVYGGTPTLLYPLLIATVGGKDVAVNKYAGNGLYKNGSEYIYRGGITKTNANGLATTDYATDVDSGNEVNNYIKVPWEDYSTYTDCTSTSNKCYRIIKINADGSIKIIRDRNLANQVFDNTHNTDASNNYSQSGTHYGYNDLLGNTPSAGHPEEYRAYSLIYTYLYGTNGYQNTTIKPYKNILQPYDLCLNKVNAYKNLNGGTATFVSDTCDITGKPNTTAVSPLKDIYVGAPYLEDYLNASTESTCIQDSQYQCRNQNYLYNKTYYWSLNAYSSNSWYVRFVNGFGNASYGAAYNSLGVRPVVILKPSILITGGSGTQASPYIIMG